VRRGAKSQGKKQKYVLDKNMTPVIKTGSEKGHAWILEKILESWEALHFMPLFKSPLTLMLG